MPPTSVLDAGRELGRVGGRNKRQTASEPLSPLIIGNIVERGVNAVGHSLSSCADLFCWVSHDSIVVEGKKEG